MISYSGGNMNFDTINKTKVPIRVTEKKVRALEAIMEAFRLQDENIIFWMEEARKNKKEE